LSRLSTDRAHASAGLRQLYVRNDRRMKEPRVVWLSIQTAGTSASTVKVRLRALRLYSESCTRVGLGKTTRAQADGSACR
jgi:hypothetical protein